MLMSIFKANRSLNSLTPHMKKRVETFLKQCKDENVPVFVTEAGRTKGRQQYLYSIGRYGENKDKGKVTWTLNSNHMRGEAIDIAFDHPGNIYQGNWEKVYRIASQNGLKSLYAETGYDRPHLNFDHQWKPKPNRRAYEDDLIKWGIVTIPKDLDRPPTREEMYKIDMELFSRLYKKIHSLEKEIRKLKNS